MRKCGFVIPYFGTFPRSFEVFLKSCAYNTNYDWLVFTDDHKEYDYPQNVKVHYIEFNDLKRIVDEKFGFHVAMDKPYKLCDLKPAYGFLFEEYLENYLSWGHCDIDTIMGNLDQFITDERLEKYDKIFCLGHMTIYKNTFENNRVFMSRYKGKELYREVYTNPASCWFDEEWHDENNINQIFLTQGRKVLQIDWSANFDIKYQNFRRVIYSKNKNGKWGYLQEGKKDALYIWDNGKTYRISHVDGKLVKEEFLYMHFQHRNMKFAQSILDKDKFKIVPNSFLPLKKVPESVQEYKLIAKHTICFYSLQKSVTKLKKKINRFRKKIFRKVLSSE